MAQIADLKRITISREVSWLINNFGFVVIYESARKVELIADDKTGRPFKTREEAHKVAQHLVNEIDAIEAHAVEVKPSGGYSSTPA